MLSSRTARRRAALLIGVIGAAGAVPAGLAGAEDTGTPVPCDTVAIQDPAGDQVVGPILGSSPVTAGTSKGPDNVDITKVFFNTTKGADGKWRTTVNIGITNLTKAVPPESRTGVVSYTLEFVKNNEDILNVRARSDGTTVTYKYSVGQRVESAAASTERPTQEKDTTGRFIEGPDGMVEIVLPDAIAAPGTTFEDVFVIVSQRDGLAQVGYRFDSAPDDEATSALTYTVTECPAAQAPEVPAVTVPEVPVTAPGTPQARRTVLPVKAASALGSAKRAARKRSLAVKLTAAVPVSGLTVQLRNAKGKVLGRGSLARLTGTRTLKLKVARNIKKGRYVLAMAGTAEGQALTATQSVVLKK